jgi:predicted nucleic acid-binding protein
MPLFDASSIIHAWDNYPPELFPPLWDWLEQEIVDGNLAIPGVALEEVGKKAPECAAWLKGNGIIVFPLTSEVLAESLRIKHLLGIEEDQYHTKGVGENDIFIIATASFHGLTLISDEGRQFGKPESLARYKIPAVCELQKVGVNCINFLQLIRTSGAVFKS